MTNDIVFALGEAWNTPSFRLVGFFVPATDGERQTNEEDQEGQRSKSEVRDQRRFLVHGQAGRRMAGNRSIYCLGMGKAGSLTSTTQNRAKDQPIQRSRLAELQKSSGGMTRVQLIKNVEQWPRRIGKLDYLRFLNGEKLTRKEAIQSKCFECVTWEDVQPCLVDTCPLHSFCPWNK